MATAQAQRSTFAQSSAPGMWPFLDKATMGTHVRPHLADPAQVNSGKQPFFGLTALLFEWAGRQPVDRWSVGDHRDIQFCQS